MCTRQTLGAYLTDDRPVKIVAVCLLLWESTDFPRALTFPSWRSSSGLAVSCKAVKASAFPTVTIGPPVVVGDSRTILGGKGEGPLGIQSGDQSGVAASERFPSESSKDAMASAFWLPSGEFIRERPLGIQSPLDRNLFQPCSSGMAPKLLEI